MYVSWEANKFNSPVSIEASLNTVIFEPWKLVVFSFPVLTAKFFVLIFEDSELVEELFVCLLFPFTSKVIPAEKPKVPELEAATDP